MRRGELHTEGSREIWMSAAEFSVPIDERYFEDYVPGPVFEYGPIAVSEAEIIDFAKKFDPQYIHTDPEKAARGPFGGLIASGWHTSSLMMRLYADNYLSSVASARLSGHRRTAMDQTRASRAILCGSASRRSIRAVPNRSRIWGSSACLSKC